MPPKKELHAARIRSAATLLREVVADYGVYATMQAVARLLVIPCKHWDIEERIVGGDTHERQCLHCYHFEEMPFAKLVPEPGLRRIRKVDLRKYKDGYVKYNG